MEKHAKVVVIGGGVVGCSILYHISKFGLNNPVEAVIHGTVTASYTVSGFGLEKLCKINNEDFNNKIMEIQIN